MVFLDIVRDSRYDWSIATGPERKAMSVGYRKRGEEMLERVASLFDHIAPDDLVLKEICAQANVSAKIAQRYRVRRGAAIKPPRGLSNPITPAEAAEYVRLASEERLDCEQIAPRFGRNVESVRIHLVRAGITGRRARKIRIEGKIAYVPLTQGKEAIIDAVDVHLVEAQNWHFQKSRMSDTGYACGEVNGRTIQMHNVIMPPPQGMLVDHIHHNGLDNRRSELRHVTRRGNKMNARGRNRHGHRCVFKFGDKFHFKYHSPKFDTPEEAFQAYLRCVAIFDGEDAPLTNKNMPALSETIDPDTGEVLDG